MGFLRRHVAPVSFVGSALALALMAAGCSLGSSGSSAPTSTIPKTEFRTIPETPPKPTQPTAPAGATPTTGAAVVQQQAVDPAVRTIYTVQKGDVPYSIAQKFDVPLDALYKLNDLDPKRPAMRVGMKLKIPRILPPTTTNDKGEHVYVVVLGDSPLGISNKFGIPLQTIIDLNGLDPAKPAVYVGQQIKLPG